MYSTGEVRGILRHYTQGDDTVGSIAHLKMIDIKKHFPFLPMRVKQVLYYVGICGHDFRTVAFTMNMHKDTVFKYWEQGTMILCRNINRNAS